MTKDIIHDSDLHFEHIQWKKELAFWKDEIRSFKKRLSEIAAHYTDKNVLLQLDHFQNEFRMHGDIIYKIHEAIRAHEKNLAVHRKTYRKAVDSMLALRHIDYRDKMEKERELYAALKKEFYAFLTEYR